MIKVLVYVPPTIGVSLESTASVSVENFLKLKATVDSLSSSYTQLNNTLGYHLSHHKVDWTTGIDNKPSTFTPSAHKHSFSDIENFVLPVHRHAISDIDGLSSYVDYTSTLYVGDINSGNSGSDMAYATTITLPKIYPMIGPDNPSYVVLGCLRSKVGATSVTYDDSFWQIYDPTSNSFGLTIRTVDVSETQNLYFDYAILVK